MLYESAPELSVCPCTSSFRRGYFLTSVATRSRAGRESCVRVAELVSKFTPRNVTDSVRGQPTVFTNCPRGVPGHWSLGSSTPSPSVSRGGGGGGGGGGGAAA